MKTNETTNKTTATERLLNVIRGNSTQNDTPQPESSLPGQLKPLKPRREEKTILNKTGAASVTVGIDIGHNNIHLIKVVRANNKAEVAEHKSIPLPANLERESLEFDNFLQAAVAPFCSAERKTNTWFVMSSAHCEVRLIRIPKVSAKHLGTTINWTLKKEASFNENEFFFDYEVRGETGEPGNKKLEVMCYIAPTAEVEGVKALFSRIRVPLTGISIIPFAIQNIFLNHWATLSEKHITCLFIGTSHSRIDLYTEGKLILTRNINTGLNSMTDMLTESLNYRTADGGRLATEEARKILFTLTENPDAPVVLAEGFTITKGEIETLVAPVLERLVRQMERTFEHFTLTHGGERNVGKIYISSIMPIYKAMTEYFSAQLGAECHLFDPLKQVLTTSSFSERISAIAAFGMALSDNAYTPNFIYTFKDKEKTASIIKINRLILTGLISSVLICSGVFAWGQVSVAQRKTELARLEHQTKQLIPPVNKETLAKLTSANLNKQQRYMEISRRYKGVALIAELSALTPESVSLTSLKADFREKTGSEKANNIPPKTENLALIEGVIKGKQDILEMLLVSYVMKLKASPMFSDVTVSTSKVEPAKKGAFLTFALNLKVGPGK